MTGINKQGRYGKFGGRYLPEILITPVKELENAFNKIMLTQKFQKIFTGLLKNYAGRETPLTEVARFSKAINGPTVYLKREDLLHTGAHKINNVLGQCLLAKEMGKTRIIAETGAGQHGVAAATVCAHLGLDCIVYMGAIDIERQAPNVRKMKLLNATVKSVCTGSKTLKDAINEALRDYATNYETSHYCLGSALGPHPYPEMVRIFQSVIGTEVKRQSQEMFGDNPNTIIACVGGGSNAIGIFSPFIDDTKVKLIGVEAGGYGCKLGQHASRFRTKTTGVLHGCYSFLLQNAEGQIATTHSISAGLDYPSVGPLHAELFETGRATYVAASDQEAVAALKLLSETEGIIPALESAHALGYLMKIAKNFNKSDKVIVNLSGRGDKDLPQLFSKGFV